MDSFENEIKPAIILGMYSKEKLGIKIETRENPSDPPDHFATINNKQQVNLELTQLSDDQIFKVNSFSTTTYDLIVEYIEKYKNELPNGKYLVLFELGETVTQDGWEFTVPTKNKASKADLKKGIDMSIRHLVKNFSGKRNSTPIKNKKNEMIGIIHLSRRTNDGNPAVYVMHQSMSISMPTVEYLSSKLQQCIDSKELLYKNKYINQSNEWWLLIHDLKDYSRASPFISDISKEKYTFDFFERVLFLCQGFGSYSITDLQKDTETIS